jgi:hypothetical protein
MAVTPEWPKSNGSQLLPVPFQIAWRKMGEPIKLLPILSGKKGGTEGAWVSGPMIADAPKRTSQKLSMAAFATVNSISFVPSVDVGSVAG